jgi:hypothetical protein
MTSTLQENVWSGLSRETPASILAINIPTPEVRERVPQIPNVVRQFSDRGRLEIPNSPFTLPVQDFLITFTPGGDVIENQPQNAWPKIRFEVPTNRGQSELGVNVLLRPSDDTVEAEVLYTRVWYTLINAGDCRLSLATGFPLAVRVQPESPEEVSKILNRAKLYRKLAFLEKVFRVSFQLPRYIPAEEIRKIEIVFRGITEGEFSTRNSDITFENLIPSELNLDAPPFSEPGPFSRAVGDKEYVLGQWLDLGQLTIILPHAELANPRMLMRMAEAPDAPVNLRFLCPYHQIIHRFGPYAAMPTRRRVRRLNGFVHDLAQSEPAELANTIRDLLVSDVSAESAIQIASDWLMLNRLPDRLSAQSPEVDSTLNYWHVPIHLVYAGGENGLVGEVNIDIKTGEVIKATPIDELFENARDLGERIVHAR